MISDLRLYCLLFVPIAALSCASTPKPHEPAPAPEPMEKEEEKVASWVPGPSAEEIQQVVGTRDAELRQCYLAGTFKDSQLSGTVNVLFTISPDGKVSRASDAGSDLDDPDVVSCVLDVFGALEFARGGSSDTEVQYPVVFGRHG